MAATCGIRKDGKLVGGDGESIKQQQKVSSKIAPRSTIETSLLNVKKLEKNKKKNKAGKTLTKGHGKLAHNNWNVRIDGIVKAFEEKKV